MVETTTRTVNLPESEPEVFAIYVKWLYSGCFYIKEDDDCLDEDEDDDFTLDREWNKFSACYRLSDFLQDRDFLDAVIDMAIEKMHTDDATLFTMAEHIYPYTFENSPHRKFIVDLAVHT